MKEKKKKKKKFKSELDWRPESWFAERLVEPGQQLYTEEDARILESHVPEYEERERKAKEDGTWLKMPDGSTWGDDPRVWVMMQSDAFRKNCDPNIYYAGYFGQAAIDAAQKATWMWGANDPGAADTYAYIENSTADGNRYDDLEDGTENPDKYEKGYNIIFALPKGGGNYFYAKGLEAQEGGYPWLEIPFNLKKMVFDPSAPFVKTDDIAEAANNLGYDYTLIPNVIDGNTRSYTIPVQKAREYEEYARTYGFDEPSASYGLEFEGYDPITDIIINPRFSNQIKIIKGNNGNFDRNIPNKYAYQNNNLQNNIMQAKKGMKLIPRKFQIGGELESADFRNYNSSGIMDQQAAMLEEPQYYKGRAGKRNSKKTNFSPQKVNARYNVNDLTSKLIFDIASPYFGLGYFINTASGRDRFKQQGRTPPSGLGKKLGEPIDCSGWTREFYKLFGIDIGEGTKNQRSNKKFYKFKDESQLRPGDLVYFEERGGIGHTGIIYKKDDNGDWLMIDSSTNPLANGQKVEGIGVRKLHYGRGILTFMRPYQTAASKKFGGKLTRLVPKKRYIK